MSTRFSVCTLPLFLLLAFVLSFLESIARADLVEGEVEWQDGLDWYNGYYDFNDDYLQNYSWWKVDTAEILGSPNYSIVWLTYRLWPSNSNTNIYDNDLWVAWDGGMAQRELYGNFQWEIYREPDAWSGWIEYAEAHAIEPHHFPNFYNSNLFRQDVINCLLYFENRDESDFQTFPDEEWTEAQAEAWANPRWAIAGISEPSDVTVANMKNGLLQRAGWTFTNNPNEAPPSPGARLGYVIIHPGKAYHVVNREPDGGWTTKSASLPVVYKDSANNTITNPATAEFFDTANGLDYDTPVGYFWYTPSVVNPENDPE